MSHVLSIKGDPFYPEILLDGKEVKGLIALDLRIRAGEITTATLELHVATEIEAGILDSENVDRVKAQQVAKKMKDAGSKTITV